MNKYSWFGLFKKIVQIEIFKAYLTKKDRIPKSYIIGKNRDA